MEARIWVALHGQIFIDALVFKSWGFWNPSFLSFLTSSGTIKLDERLQSAQSEAVLAGPGSVGYTERERASLHH